MDSFLDSRPTYAEIDLAALRDNFAQVRQAVPPGCGILAVVKADAYGHGFMDIAQELEQVALNDPYFIERKLYPNVDFYSGVIYRALGIPVGMFTVLFAMGRLPGWIAHWVEMHQNPQKRICRPRQVYVGPQHRKFKPLSER